jgi:hypothetical protein
MPVPGDVVCTGHISSSDGDISMVKNLPAKLAAAAAAPSITAIFCPDLQADDSLSQLSPREREQAEASAAAARSRIEVVPVAHVAELVRKVFSDQKVVLAALSNGFYEEASLTSSDGAAQAARALTQNISDRFWTCLEQCLQQGDSTAAKKLLTARIEYHVSKESYAQGFGGTALCLLQSVPPATRRLKLNLPLVKTKDCIRLSQFAGQGDQEDVQLLFEFASAKEGPVRRPPPVEHGEEEARREEEAEAAVEAVISEINERALSEKIGVPIDEARNSFTGAKVQVGSYAEFNQTIEAFYAHLLLHTEGLVGSVEGMPAGKDAQQLLKRAFSRRGGYEAALAEATEPTRGGLRYVLDILTDRFKMDKQENHVYGVLRDALDVGDMDAKREFMRVFRERVGPKLPAEIHSLPVDALAKNYEKVVRAYVRAQDQFERVLRRL